MNYRALDFALWGNAPGVVFSAPLPGNFFYNDTCEVSDMLLAHIRFYSIGLVYKSIHQADNIMRGGDSVIIPLSVATTLSGVNL